MAGISRTGGYGKPLFMPRRSDPANVATTPLADRTLSSDRSVSVGAAFAIWAIGWLTGNILASVVISASGEQNVPTGQRSVWIVGALSIALWGPQLAALVVVLRRGGYGSLVAQCRLRFKPVDLLGIPIGIASQIGLLTAVYAPLRHWWPDAFSTERLERNARELYDSAHGGWLVMLVVVVVVGAPVVEELIYRGVIQHSLIKRLGNWPSIVLSAAFFALIHFRPVEFPGLFAFALILGCCLVVTQRIGMGIVAHMAFNATALVIIAR
jgi:uncharacterized protein